MQSPQLLATPSLPGGNGAGRPVTELGATQDNQAAVLKPLTLLSGQQLETSRVRGKKYALSLKIILHPEKKIHSRTQLSSTGCSEHPKPHVNSLTTGAQFSSNDSVAISYTC